MRIKICGITNKDDALCVAEAGADALGFIFVKGSARTIQPLKAAEIGAALPGSVLTIGVFVNEKREVIQRTIREARLGAIQLHGDEPPDAMLGYDIPVIKAYRVKRGFNVDAMRAYNVSAHLLDAWVEGQRGGSGQVCDWESAARAAQIHRIILSGGLHPGNVAQAIGTVRPFAVDVSSGVEMHPGVKDRVRVQSFVDAARNAFDQMNQSQRS